MDAGAVRGCDGCGFVFPDDDALVQAEFERNLPFAQSVANSAVNPDDPKTVTGTASKPFYVDSDDPYKRGNPGVHLRFARSYGDPQPVAVIAKRSLGAVEVKYRINGAGPVLSAPMSEWEGGSGYNPASVYYHQIRGVVTGTDPGDSVEVWFEGGGQRSGSFTYQAVSESGNRVLVVAAEDYTGASPVQAPWPALRRHVHRRSGRQRPAGRRVRHRRRRADRPGRPRSAQPLRCRDLGDRKRPGRPAPPDAVGGDVDQLAIDELLEFRSYINEGGTVLLAGDSAGQQYTNATVGNQFYDPKARSPATRCPRVRTRGAAFPRSARSAEATP